ncbi:MAG TPA: beta-N-acetylhexosaminidase [Polyangiaceae bacterium]|jgi:beta-N-acetylhexosaminidase|nr:beta-N-acetylhexosaminidase [Polyangiaceae bacterium]
MREVERLTSSELAGQLLVAGFTGTELPASIERALRARALGGVILFTRNLPSVAAAWGLCQGVVGASDEDFPPFIAIDQEGGRVARLKAPVLQLPPMRMLGQLDDLTLSKKLATRLAEELSALGFNLNFAPVADVDSNPNNPVIGDRSFGNSPTLVTRHCKAFLEGFAEAGVMGCLKHFPGHGDTDKDSHFELPQVTRSIVKLRQTEMFPFEHLARHAPAMMTAHVVYSAIDRLPATLSARLCQGLLRKEFGFEGVLFGDDLEMAALRERWTPEQSAILSIEAGCDVLLVCSDEGIRQRIHGALVEKIEADRPFRERSREAVIRALIQRRRFPPRPFTTLAEVNELFAAQTGSEAGRWVNDQQSPKKDELKAR